MPELSQESTERIHAVDVARGIAMALMVLDHTRVFAAVPPGGTEAGVFLTRWVTHFCAPTFLFLSGVSAFLSSRRRNRANLSRHLLSRGLGLLALELVVVRTGWTFNFGFDEYLLAGVIWSIGWSMILMAALIRLPTALLATFSGIVIAGHNLLPFGNPWVESYSWPWRLLYTGGLIQIGEQGPVLVVLYSVFPWVGLMAAGYVFGRIFTFQVEKRARICWLVGGAAMLVFVVLRGCNLYGDPRPWEITPECPTWMSFLGTNKYPASFLFVLMTLGPVITLLPWLDHARGHGGRLLARFGRVPLFFYLLHIPLIHLVAILISLVRTPNATSWLFGDHPVTLDPVPEGYRYGLPLLYLVAAACLVVLSLACRVYERFIQGRKVQ